jgi:hypothetical protein
MNRGLATKLGFGDAAVRFYHKPKGWLKQMLVEGGPLEQHRTVRGHDEMRVAAKQLPQLSKLDEAYPIPIRFLSGFKYWHQTVFCIASLQHVCSKRVDAIVFDDGTLSQEVRDQILSVVPWVRFVVAEEISDRLEFRVPASRYPCLRSRREVYPHLRKLTDLHDNDSWSLVFDSDMLFFRRPDALLSWMEAPKDVVFIEDVVRSYGYSDALMHELSRGNVPDRMNVGLYGIHGAEIDFDYLEYCARLQIDRERVSYVQEQALTALLVSGKPWTVLPRADYCVLPDLQEGRKPTAALHHYVAHSKRSYFQFGWQRVLTELNRI